jgi:hypothetical protein
MTGIVVYAHHYKGLPPKKKATIGPFPAVACSSAVAWENSLSALREG